MDAGGEDLFVLGKYFLQKYAKEFSSKVKGLSPWLAAVMSRPPAAA